MLFRIWDIWANHSSSTDPATTADVEILDADGNLLHDANGALLISA